MAAAKKKTAAKKKAPAKTTPKAPAKKVAKKATKKAPAKKVAPKKAPAKKAVAKKAPRKARLSGSPVDPLSLDIQPYQTKKGEEYMNEDQVEHFHNILEHWKAELMHEVDRTVHHMQDDATHFPDPNDRATQESEFSLELRTRDRERKLIRKIDESIGNLDNDEYGFCEGCGVEIGIRRLEARPTASLCIDCKVLDEIREKQWR